MTAGGILAFLTSCLKRAQDLLGIDAIAERERSVAAGNGVGILRMVSKILEAYQWALVWLERGCSG